MEKHTFSTLILPFALVLKIMSADPALAQDGQGGKRDKRQPPVQVIVQIIVTTIVLRLIEPWVIPKN